MVMLTEKLTENSRKKLIKNLVKNITRMEDINSLRLMMFLCLFAYWVYVVANYGQNSIVKVITYCSKGKVGVKAK